MKQMMNSYAETLRKQKAEMMKMYYSLQSEINAWQDRQVISLQVDKDEMTFNEAFQKVVELKDQQSRLRNAIQQISSAIGNLTGEQEPTFWG